MMTSLPVTKYTLVYASPAEAETNFKMLQFTCIGPFRRSHTHFEGVLPKREKPAARLCTYDSVRYDASVLAHKIMSEA